MTFHYRIEIVRVLLFDFQSLHAHQNIEFQNRAICLNKLNMDSELMKSRRQSLAKEFHAKEINHRKKGKIDKELLLLLN